MAQRKKKVNTYQNQKLAAAQHKNEYFRKFKYIINTISGEDIYTQIPKYILENVYKVRSHSLKVIVPDGNTVPYEILNDAKCILSAWSKREKIAVTADGFEITLDEFFTIGLTIINLYNSLTIDDLPYVSRLKSDLGYYQTNIETIFNKANENLYGILFAFGIGISDVSKTLYWYKHEIINTPDYVNGINNIVSIFSHNLESQTVEIDGNSRPVKLLGWASAYVGVEFIRLKPSVFNINKPFANIDLDVYIQSHALQRLIERIDCFQTGIIHMNMYLSFKEPKVFYDNNKNILVEFRLFNSKAGYFRVDIVEGKIIIRTFLFVTNSGTPEGQLLEKNTGLQKLDKKYLALDKLSTFMTSDIDKNEEVVKILKTSGCQCLIDLYEKLNPILTKKDNKFDADLMLNYVNFKAFNISDISENTLSETSILSV